MDFKSIVLSEKCQSQELTHILYDSIYVIYVLTVLVLLVHYNYVRSNHWGELGKRYRGFLSVLFMQFSVTLKLFQNKMFL